MIHLRNRICAATLWGGLWHTARSARTSGNQPDRPSDRTSPTTRGILGVMNTPQILTASFSALSLALSAAGNVAHAQDCQPGISDEYGQDQSNYNALIAAVVPELGHLSEDLHTLGTAPSTAIYAEILEHSTELVTTLGSSSRVVITLQDGTVVIDTSKGAGNTLAAFQAKTINENHNSRLAILTSQKYPCGVGIERNFNSTLLAFETSLAVRLGDHLNSDGTIHLSK
jgi:hypothetical protein